MRGSVGVAIAALALTGSVPGRAQMSAQESPVQSVTRDKPWEYGVLVQGGKGFTDHRDDFKFIMAGAHLGKVLTPTFGHGILQGNLEYAGEIFPYWQSNTPKFQRYNCVATQNPIVLNCAGPYTTGGTYHGVSITPIMVRWNFTNGKRIMPWVQAAGGVLWTNHKYPGYGNGPLNIVNDGPGSGASVWNFTPQGGVGIHYFARPKQSIDFSANGVHISSASLGDRNPGVNASVQFSLGYSWWK